MWGVIMNNVAMNIYAQVFCGCMFSVLFGLYLGVELLGHMFTLCLTFSGTAKLFSKVAAPFCMPTSNAMYVLISLCQLLCLFDYTHPSGCEIVPYYDFDLHFLEG